MARTTAAQYFVRIDTYWQNSPDYFVGPFDSRDGAQAAIENIDYVADNVWLSTQGCGGNIKDAIRVFPTILTATEAKRMGMRDDYSSRHNTVPMMPTRERGLFEMMEEVRGPY